MTRLAKAKRFARRARAARDLLFGRPLSIAYNLDITGTKLKVGPGAYVAHVHMKP